MNDTSQREFVRDLQSPICAKLVGAMPEPAIIVGLDGRVAAANEPAKSILPSLKIGEPLVLSLRSPDILDGLRRAMTNACVETVLWSERVPVERLFDVYIAPLSSSTNEPAAALLTLRDLTDTRKVERMRVDFIANASHELRTPLASLLGFIETLQGPARDDAAARAKFLAIMREQGRRMARLVDDLLSLSRIEQKQHVRPDDAVDLTLVARHVADTLGPLAHEFGVQLKIEAEGQVVVTGDRDELVRVAENLIDNAIKYGGASDNAQTNIVEIVVSKNAREGWISVRDYGRGIAPEHLPRLTERFYRIDAGQSRSKGGTGLGLAIVKHIMSRHRGRLTITSEISKGSTFMATAPLHFPRI